MRKGTLYTIEEFISKEWRKSDNKKTFIERELKKSGKSYAQMYRDLNNPNVMIFKSNDDIHILNR